MRRTHILIGVLAATVVVLAIALAYTIGRRGWNEEREKVATGNSLDPSASATNQRATGVEPVAGNAAQTAPNPNSDAELSRWIIGAWASSTCDTDNGEEFALGGRYYGYESEGGWRIENGNLIVTVTRAQQDPNAGLGEGEITPVLNPRPAVTPIIRNGPNRMGLVVDGRRSSMIRCSNPTASRSPRNE